MSTAARSAKPRKEPKRRSKSAAADAGPGLPARLADLLLPASGRDRAILAAIVLVGFLLRATKLLTMFPILVDESIYLRWAQIIQ